jgi:hypothetical protein
LDLTIIELCWIICAEKGSGLLPVFVSGLFVECHNVLIAANYLLFCFKKLW